MIGGVPAGLTMAALPVISAGVKQAVNPNAAKLANALRLKDLRRGATIGYGTVLAPGQED
jgi:hypothetical protein